MTSVLNTIVSHNTLLLREKSVVRKGEMGICQGDSQPIMFYVTLR
jgi:hypothetical protein